MKRLLILAALALGLTGCAGIPGGEALTTGVAAVSDVLAGPDTDYKNYLTACRAEVKAQAEAYEADSKALQSGLTSGNKETQYGSTLIMAFKAGQGGPKLGCTMARKKGNMELLMDGGDNGLVGLGKFLYSENREASRFKRQLEADNERFRLSTNRATAEQRENNSLIRDLSGTRPDEANRSRVEADVLRIEADKAAAPVAQ